MNDKIKQLAFQAGFVGESMYPIIGTSQETALQNFLELIIKDCTKIVSLWSSDEPCCEGYDILPVIKIKEHFGVE